MHILKLHRGREQSVLRRHPWIFSRAIQHIPKSIADGDTVWIADADENIIGTGHFQDSSLAVRLLAFDKVNPDPAFWKSRLQQAMQVRQRLSLPAVGSTDAFRLVHGEGDMLSGLIIDIYGSVAVVQAHSIGMHKARTLIAETLLQIDPLHLKAVYCKSKEALPSGYAGQITDEWLAGEATEEVIIRENGIQFAVQVVTGQKTGFFLDQRINRQIIGSYAQGALVLNAFSYSGGFSLYALQHGASHVISVDSSAPALELAEKNVRLNAFPGLHDAVKENVLTYLGHGEEKFDIVIIDPPAFAKSLDKRHSAVKAYKRLNVQALQRVKPGGMLFTFSCSQVVDRALFNNTIVAAAIDCKRPVRILHELSQGPDHPVSIFHPEGHYLKGLGLYVD